MQNSLGTFAKLQTAIISFVMSVRMDQLGSQWTNFHKILYVLINLKKSAEKIQV
jgi:hypothetical protein